MISYKIELFDGCDLRDWCYEEGWNIEEEISKLDEYDLWEELFDWIEETNGILESATALNDIIRFGLDDVDWFSAYIGEED